jgi:hypothetical protein
VRSSFRRRNIGEPAPKPVLATLVVMTSFDEPDESTDYPLDDDRPDDADVR